MKKTTLATYIWTDADGSTRSKLKVLKHEVRFLRDLPIWNFDGSSTGQAEGKYSDVLLKPQRMYADPVRGKPHVLVLCDCWDEVEQPNACNTRVLLKQAVDAGKIENAAVKLDQTYLLLERKTNTPIAWKDYKNVGFRDGTYYCGTGGNRAFGQRIVELHAEMCLEAGVNLIAYSAEKTPGMWKFELDTMETLKAFDDHIIAKYLMCLITEKDGLYPSYDPRPYYEQKVGAQLTISVPHAIFAEDLATELKRSIKVTNVRGREERLAVETGCEVVYALCNDESRSDCVKERTAECTDKRAGMIKSTQRIHNGTDGYLLMSKILRLKTA